MTSAPRLRTTDPSETGRGALWRRGREGLAVGLVSCVLLLAPLPVIAADRVWAGFCGALLIAAIALVSFDRPEARARRIWPLWVTAACFAGVVLWQVMHRGGIRSEPGFPREALALLMPGGDLSMRPAPQEGLLAAIAYIAAFAAGYFVLASRDRAFLAFRFFAFAGAAYALIGIGNFLLAPGSVLWREKLAHIAFLTSPFVNRNIAAAFLGAALIVNLGFVQQAVKQMPARSLSEWLRSFSAGELRIGRGAGHLAACLVITAAMMMTGSRAGIALTVLGGVVSAVLYMRSTDVPRAQRRLIRFLAVPGLLILVIAFVASDSLAVRLDRQGFNDGNRGYVYAGTLKMIEERPWTGWGLGRFAEVFPAFRVEGTPIWGAWTRAHNTPLEIAAELGLPFAAVLVTGWLYVAVYLLRSAADARERPVVATAAAIWLCAGLHSLVDYPLQIPGYAIPVLILAGAAFAQPLRPRQAAR